MTDVIVEFHGFDGAGRVIVAQAGYLISISAQSALAALPKCTTTSISVSPHPSISFQSFVQSVKPISATRLLCRIIMDVQISEYGDYLMVFTKEDQEL